MNRLLLKDSGELRDELENFQDIASYLKPKPGEVRRLQGFDIFGETIPLNGVLGGDHIIYLDFKQRYDLDARIAQAIAQIRPDVAANLAECRKRAGIVLADVSGHKFTDALLAAMLHQAFLLGSVYELDVFGEITRHLFELQVGVTPLSRPNRTSGGEPRSCRREPRGCGARSEVWR